MKVEKIRDEAEFQPYEVLITVESKDEEDFFRTLTGSVIADILHKKITGAEGNNTLRILYKKFEGEFLHLALEYAVAATGWSKD